MKISSTKPHEETLMFVVRIRGGAVEWADVRRGASMRRQGLT